MTDSALETEVVREGDLPAVIRLQGELDANTAPTLKSIVSGLISDGCHDMVLDMERLYFLDSTALGSLLSLHQRIPGKLSIQNPSPHVRRVLDAAGVPRVIEVRNEEGIQQQLLNFAISIEDTAQGVPIVHLRGELDAYSVAYFRGALVSLFQEGYRFVVLHLGALEFVDSIGLGGMVSVYTRLKKAGGSLYVAEPSDQIEKVLRITGLDSLFPLFNSCTEAVNSAGTLATSST